MDIDNETVKCFVMKYSEFSIILLRKRELITLLWLCSLVVQRKGRN